ncbi:MAG: glucosaminidase domain-containing protein [Bacteroidales bacterium]|jgi:hypothetical protein|nr:glucosaminidase domain-containing protein [Bacteroidales bacterium]
MKTVSKIVIFAMVWFIFSEKTLRAANPYGTGKTPIVSAPTATVTAMQQWAKNKNATPVFVELAQLFYDIAVSIGIDPVVAYTQSAKETGYGRFGGVVDSTFFNPCGMKISSGGENDNPENYERFASWVEGIKAHCDHLALYAGMNGYPKNATPDPRHFPYIYGVAPNVEDLGKRWADSEFYGNEITVLMDEVYNTVYKKIK